jgi:lipid-A-disaccharide synthase-like uncharacterized protein
VIPPAFWYLSIGGGLVLLVYSIERRDPVFVVGQATGLLIYGRNLWFLRKGNASETGED